MHATVQLVGFLASLISFIMWLPQALTVWKCRHDAAGLTGVAIGTQVLLLANATLWMVYAVLTGALWAGAPGLVNAPLAVLTIMVVHRARTARPAKPEGSAVGNQLDVIA